MGEKLSHGADVPPPSLPLSPLPSPSQLHGGLALSSGGTWKKSGLSGCLPVTSQPPRTSVAPTVLTGQHRPPQQPIRRLQTTLGEAHTFIPPKWVILPGDAATAWLPVSAAPGPPRPVCQSCGASDLLWNFPGISSQTRGFRVTQPSAVKWKKD